MAIEVKTVQKWLSKQPDLATKQDELLASLEAAADDEGVVMSRVARLVLGEETAARMFRDLFERRSS